MMNKIIPMPKEKYEILIQLGELLGITADDIVNIINVAPLITYVNELETKIKDLERNNAYLSECISSIVNYINAKEANKLNENYQDLMAVLTKQGDEDEE